MPLTKLATLLTDMDLYISQHAIYINKLEKAIENKEPFEHKDCHHCNFGAKWDELVKPVKEELPEDLKPYVEEIETIHCQFHDISKQIDPTQPKETDKQNFETMEDLSTKLFQNLLKLKHILKERGLLE
jgi:hypothetical protein